MNLASQTSQTSQTDRRSQDIGSSLHNHLNMNDVRDKPALRRENPVRLGQGESDQFITSPSAAKASQVGSAECKARAWPVWLDGD